MSSGAPLMTFDDVVRVLGSESRGSWASDAGFASVEVDSRKVGPGALFVALVGERTDGHRFLEAVFASGAVAAVVRRSFLETPEAQQIAASGGLLFGVGDTLSALQDLAAAYNKRFPDLIRIGITGSSGKTTTKELVARVLAQNYSVIATEGNFNSDIGLPLMVFRIRDHHQVAVLEMGMNRVGEMAELAGVFRPQIGLVTNIGTAHIGRLGSQDAIAVEKAHVWDYLDEEGCAFFDAEDSIARQRCDGVPGRHVPYGPGIIDDLIEILDRGLKGYEIVCSRGSVKFPLFGRYNLKNGLGAWAVGEYLGLSFDQIRRGLESMETLFGRSEILTGSATVIMDAYNANGESVAESLSFLADLFWEGDKAAVLGAMGELGEHSEDVHRDVVRSAALKSLDRVFLLGEEFCSAAEAEFGSTPPEGWFWARDWVGLSPALAQGIEAGDLILVKGSRSMKMEKVVELLRDQGVLDHA